MNKEIVEPRKMLETKTLPKNIYRILTWSKERYQLYTTILFILLIGLQYIALNNLVNEYSGLFVVLNILIAVIFVLSYRLIIIRTRRNLELEVKPQSGVGFKVQFVETERYRFKLSKDGYQPIQVVKSTNLDCAALYLTWGSNTHYTWIFVETIRPGDKEFYIQVIPYAICSEKNYFSYLDYQLERKLTIYGRTKFSIAGYVNSINYSENYMFNLLLPANKFDTNRIDEALTNVSLFKSF